LRLGWFSSGRGPGSRNLLSAVMNEKAKGELDANIEFIFCNWDNSEEQNPKKEERGKFFKLAEGYGIPIVTLSWKKFMPELRASSESEWRKEYGAEMRALLRGYGFDIGILAGYMLWMDDETCDEYDMLNLHPALPDGPKGTWQEVIRELIRNGAERQGAMIHLCTKEWDRGDAVAYCGFPIRGPGYDELWADALKKTGEHGMDNVMPENGSGLFAKIREDGAKRELPLIVSAIKAFADGTVTIKGKRLYRNGKRLDGPVDLSGDVEKRIHG